MTPLILLVVSLLSWLIATITAGGAGIIYLAAASVFISVPLATVTLGIAGTITGACRVWIYRKDVCWPIAHILLPGTLLGAGAGASMFGLMLAAGSLAMLQIFLAVFLVGSGLAGLLRLNPYGGKPELFWFFPMGACTGFVSGLVGAAGPVLNGLFQEFSLQPQQIVGTKALNIFVQQMTKAIIYILAMLFSGREVLADSGLNPETTALMSGVAVVGGVIGVLIGRKVLAGMRADHFGRILNMMMILYGVYLGYVAVVRV